MSTDPIAQPPEPVDPTSLPVFAPPHALARPRPGRVRGAFSMRPQDSVEQDGPVPLEQARRRHGPVIAPAAPQPGPAPGEAGSAGGEIDWGLVTAFRTVVAQRLVQALGRDWREGGGAPDVAATPGPALADRSAQERFGWEVITELLAEHTADAVTSGAPAWTVREQALMAQAVFDAVFRLGRLQPLVDDDRVENIFIVGHDKVLLELVDGSRIPGPAGGRLRRGADRLPAVPGQPAARPTRARSPRHPAAAPEARRRRPPGGGGVGDQPPVGGDPPAPADGRHAGCLVERG